MWRSFILAYTVHTAGRSCPDHSITSTPCGALLYAQPYPQPHFPLSFPLPSCQGDPAKLAEIERIEALCAEKLGVWTRLYMYQQLLQDKGLSTQALCQVRGVGCGGHLVWTRLYM